jgi:peptidoglycan-associated lipoprotein
MNRKWTATVWILALVLVTLTVACGPKEPPVTTPEVEVAPPPEPPEEVPPPVEPPVVEDKKPDWWSEDMQTLTDQVHKAGLLGDVYFDFDKYDLRPDARARLEKNAAFLREHPDWEFTLEGHCDERGTNEYNLALGERRASAAKNFLASLGVNPARLRTISYGEERPFCSDHNEGCWSRNRRAHFLVTRADLG